MPPLASVGGQVALDLGGSGGLGLAFARALLDRPEVERVVVTSRQPEASETLVQLHAERGNAVLPIRLDVRDERSIAAAAERVADACGPRLHWLLNCAGVLHDGADIRPEKKLEQVDAAKLRAVFEVNAFGPLLVARHFFPLLAHDERAVLANVSARVGSIGDNYAGGWYAYRASKAAQNMFTANLAIELGRRAPNVICLALHPGTVDTALSKPFSSRVPADRLFRPSRSARYLLGVIDDLTPVATGGFFAWDGTPIED